MVSAFGWLDTDPQQRKKMLEVVELFKEEGTVDELGIGSIRDAIANSLFPGTSVLHTRLRYVLFIPWLLQRAARKATPAEMAHDFRNLEIRLIPSLEAGGERSSVIGINARAKLKRTAAMAYWASLSRWGVLTTPTSMEGFFRRQADCRALAKRSAVADDAESRDQLVGTGLDPHLPKPPGNLLQSADFTLTGEEERYLTDQISTWTRGSLFSWLINNPTEIDVPAVWHIANLREAPNQLVELIDHARRFHTAIYGAPLLYNLLLAERSGQDSLVDAYRIELTEWEEELQATAVIDGWSRTNWWAAIRKANPRLNVLTIAFVR